MSVEDHSKKVLDAIYHKKDDVWIGNNLMIKIGPWIMRLIPSLGDKLLYLNF